MTFIEHLLFTRHCARCRPSAVNRMDEFLPSQTSPFSGGRQRSKRATSAQCEKCQWGKQLGSKFSTIDMAWLLSSQKGQWCQVPSAAPAVPGANSSVTGAGQGIHADILRTPRCGCSSWSSDLGSVRGGGPRPG